MEKTKREKELEAQVEQLSGQIETLHRQLEEMKDEAVPDVSLDRDTHESYLNEYVDVRLFKDNGKYKEPLYVGINGKNCMIPRGEFVRIKRKFAFLIEQSEIQEMKAAETLQQAKDRYAQESVQPTLM